MRILILIVFLYPFLLKAQQSVISLNHEINYEVNKAINQNCEVAFTSFKPLLKSLFKYNIDSVQYKYGRDSSILNKLKHTWFWRKLRTEDFIILDYKDFHLRINPLLNLEFGKQKGNDSTFTINTRGLEIKGEIGTKVYFYSSFYENQAFYIPYIDSKIRKTYVVPGQGAPKIYKINGHDFSMATGYISYSPFEFLNFQIGHGKNFIGEGYRSLLLSDNSFVYPFFKTILSLNNIQYTILYTEFQNFEEKYYYYHTRKHGTFNYLTWKPFTKIELGIFEGIIWRTSDGSSYVRNFNSLFYVPLPFIRLLSNKVVEENNVVLGMNLKYKISEFFQFYGQLANNNYDGLKNNMRVGYQAGIKCFDLFHSAFDNHNLYFQAEFNQVQPYMYAHAFENMSYSHYNQPLGHPLGANFSEILGILYYKFKDFYLQLKYNQIITGDDIKNSNYGSDILIPVYSTGIVYDSKSIAENNKTTITHQTINIGFIINPRYNLQLFAGIDIRNYKNDYTNSKTTFYNLGIKTSLNNFYFDF